VRQWVRCADIDDSKGPPGALTTAEHDELVKIPAGEVLEMDREIVKRAATFFAKESS
jgi:transposase-like protein